MTEHMPNNSGNEHAPYEAHGGGGSGIDEAEARTLIESYKYMTKAAVEALGYMTQTAVEALLVSLGYITKAGVEALGYMTKAGVEALGYMTKAASEALIVTYGYQTAAEVEALMAPGKWEEVFEELHTGIKLAASAAWRHEMGLTVLRLRGLVENTEAIKPAGVALFKLPLAARPTSTQRLGGFNVYSKLATAYTLEIATTGIVTFKPSAELALGNNFSLDGLSISLN